MKFPIKVKVPRLFFQDHYERDLPSGKVVKWGNKQVTVDLDEEGFADLKSDARHYGYGGMDWDDNSSTKSLTRSAQRTYEILSELSVEPCGCPYDYPEGHQEGCGLA